MSERRSSFIYVIYIRTTPDELWDTLTTPEFTRKYWFGMTFDSDWKVGSPWTLTNAEGQLFDSGEIAELERPRRLVLRWRHEWRPELREEGPAICIMDLEPQGDGAVKLTITHTVERPNSKLVEAVSGGWPKILSNLKSLLETGAIAIG